MGARENLGNLRAVFRHESKPSAEQDWLPTEILDYEARLFKKNSYDRLAWGSMPAEAEKGLPAEENAY